MTWLQAPPDRLPREGETLFRSKRPDYRIDENGCWIWLKALTLQGYPCDYRHRHYWERANGPITPGHHVHHRCHVPACVNPEHLEAVSPAEHFQHHHIIAKGLDIEDVLEIRRLGTVPGVRAVDVAHSYCVHVDTIKVHWRGVSWADLAGPAVLRSWPCAAPDCDEPVTGRRHKKYCSPTCRGRINGRTPDQVAKKAERQRRRRARVAAESERQDRHA